MNPEVFTPTGCNTISPDLSYSLFIASSANLSQIISPVPASAFISPESGCNFPALKRPFSLEFALLEQLTSTPHHSARLQGFDPATSKLDRYPSILPYKENQPAPSYINASLIQHPYGGGEVIFIAGQAPPKNCFSAFFEVLRVNHTKRIVVLTKEQEEGKKKCDPYWDCAEEKVDDEEHDRKWAVERLVQVREENKAHKEILQVKQIQVRYCSLKIGAWMAR